MPKDPAPPMPREYLWNCLHYDPETGKFTRKPRKDRLARWNARFAGKEAGYKAADGYRRISLDHKMLLEHRLALYMMTGLWPENVDHINRIKDDNRLCNLRPADAVRNQWNRVSRNTISGAKGVSRYQKKWRARYFQSGKEVYIGAFDTIEEAKAAYNAVVSQIRGEYFLP